jgi:hypothetical protein
LTDIATEVSIGKTPSATESAAVTDKPEKKSHQDNGTKPKKESIKMMTLRDAKKLESSTEK